MQFLSGAMDCSSMFSSLIGSFSVGMIRLAVRWNLGESSTISLLSGVARMIFASSSSFLLSFVKCALTLFLSLAV